MNTSTFSLTLGRFQACMTFRFFFPSMIVIPFTRPAEPFGSSCSLLFPYTCECLTPPPLALPNFRFCGQPFGSRYSSMDFSSYASCRFLFSLYDYLIIYVPSLGPSFLIFFFRHSRLTNALASAPSRCSSSLSLSLSPSPFRCR